MSYGSLLIVRCAACIHIYGYIGLGSVSFWNDSLGVNHFPPFIFFVSSEGEFNDFGYVGNAIFIQFKAFVVPIFR